MQCYVYILLSLILSTTYGYAGDMPGSSDHPQLPRVAGSEILGYDFNDYDAANFLKADASKKITVVNPEGKRTRILYLAKSGDKPLVVQKNYAVALSELGNANEIYSCKNKGCKSNLLANTLWSRHTMIPTKGLTHPFYLLGFSHNFTSPTYRYSDVTTDSARYHVGVFSAVIAANNSNKNFKQRTVMLVEILEVSNFEATLEFVDASEMQQQIVESGHVALYGIQFDHDKATLRPESKETITEIVKALQSDRTLQLYVVGHTDDVGSLAYNQDLSLKRANTVVEQLVSAGIESDRLTALGVGPAAPVSSNDMEAGRAKNRRVELVKRR
ncbi:MAG: OmpA family protein [Candidatus Thiodiazotropha endolucinida]